MNNTTTNKNLWEEKNSTEVNPNSSNKNESETPVIMSSTVNELEKKECENTGKKWTKNCPSCGRVQKYSTKGNLTTAIKKNKLCRPCIHASAEFMNKMKVLNSRPDHPNIGRHHTEEHKQKIRNSMIGEKSVLYGKKQPIEQVEKMRKSLTGRKLTEEHKRNMSKGMKGKIVSLETRKKLSIINKGKKLTEETKRLLSISTSKRLAKPESNPMFGKHHSNEARAKIRTKYIARMESEFNAVIVPNFNFDACKYFDIVSTTNGLTLQHALNGGEVRVEQLGYFLDAYDKEHNIAIEYDEPKHYDINGNLKEKDITRMTEIKSHLNCRFFRYNEKTKTLYEVTDTGNVIINDADLKII